MTGSVYSWDSILTLTMFLLTNFVLIFPIGIPLPIPNFLLIAIAKVLVQYRIISKPRNPSEANLTSRVYSRWRRKTVQINLHTAPLFSVLLLLASGAISGNTIRQGILGSDGIQPLDIMALFISLAYLSISLDAAGLFRFLAFWVARKGGTSGKRLYLLLYAFFFTSAVLVGNDPVVLSGTAFLAYFTRVAGITPPTAWIHAQFSAANMASAILPPSNPTNLVLTGAFSIPFLTYAAHMILPVLAAAFFVYPLLAFIFRSGDLIPHQIDMHGLDTSFQSRPQGNISLEDAPEGLETVRPTPGTLTDKHGAIIGSVLLGITLVLLVATSALKVPVWEVTVPSALLMMARDVWHDRESLCMTISRRKIAQGVTDHSGVVSLENHLVETADDIELRNRAPSSHISNHTDISSLSSRPQTLASCINYLQYTCLPTLGSIIPRLPYDLIPFALCMFILVQALASKGWIEIFANWWAAWIRLCNHASPGWQLLGAVSGMLFLATFLCNICGTNIGATILLTRVIQAWLQTAQTTDNNASPSAAVQSGTIYALALGSNFGAFSLSFSASLAGLLWRGILKQKGIHVHQKQFALLNIPVVLVAICAATAVLVVELIVIP